MVFLNAPSGEAAALAMIEFHSDDSESRVNLNVRNPNLHSCTDGFGAMESIAMPRRSHQRSLFQLCVGIFC